jgi:long-chain acyl-CoA synthetase
MKLYHNKNSISIPFVNDVTLFQAFKPVIDKHQADIAFTCNQMSLSYRDLGIVAEQFAVSLQKDLNVERGARVIILLPNMPQLPVIQLAVWQIGGVCVCLNSESSDEIVEFVIKDSNPSVMVMLSEREQELSLILARYQELKVVTLENVDHLPVWNAVPRKAAKQVRRIFSKSPALPFMTAIRRAKGRKLDEIRVNDSDLALIQYGTSQADQLNGIMITHKNLVANMQQILQFISASLQEADVIAAVVNLSDVSEFSVGLFPFLYLGKHVKIVNHCEIRNDRLLSKTFTEYCTVVAPATTLRKFRRVDTPSALKLRTLVSYGGNLSSAEKSEVSYGTGVTVIEIFGSAECTGAALMTPQRLDCPEGASGIPLPLTEARIVDANGDDIEVGNTGELWIKGPQVMRGIWRKADYSWRFVSDGWLKTKHRARTDEKGYFYFVD